MNFEDADKHVIPVDDAALDLIDEALDYHFVGEDENGEPVGSGEFSMYRLLEFWSGYDPDNITQEPGGVAHYHGYMLTHKDIIRALIDEIRRLRALGG